jgi:methyl-accepting chemotaxis protein
MERVHKANLWVIFGCVLALTLTTVLSYGFTLETVICTSILWITIIIAVIVRFLNVTDFVKAMVIILTPSYAMLVYSALSGGNSIAFIASFVTLSMAVRYFDKKIIKYYAIAFMPVVLVCMIFNYNIIDRTAVGATSKIVLWIATAVILYLGTGYGQQKSDEAEKALEEVKNNSTVANQIAYRLNTEIVECSGQVTEVTSHAEVVKASAAQMEKVVDESSRAIQTVSDKFNTSKEYIVKNYEYAKQLEKSFGVVTAAVDEGDKEAKLVKNSMIEMSETVSAASNATSGLLEQMEEITGILNDINSIAGQTNLLSLNASIEAARAGEHGKGFAVVADQIRTLSEDSRKSADSIKEIIDTLTDTVNSVVEKISAGAEAANTSQERIGELITKLELVNTSAQDATEVVHGEYEVIGKVKSEFDDIQEELTTVAATSEENASMVAEISSNIVNQTDYVFRLSNEIESLKNSSKELEEHFGQE